MEKLNFWIFIISFASMILFALIFGLLREFKIMLVAVTACSLGMLFANLERIELFKAPGFEARMRKFEEITSEKIQKLTVTLTTCMVDIIISQGRYGDTIGYEKKYQMYNNLLKGLYEMGLTHEQLKEIKEKSLWDKLVLMDHTNLFLKNIPKDKLHVVMNEISKLQNSANLSIASTDTFRNLFLKYEVLTPEIEEALKDMQFYREKQELRRPSEFFKSFK